MTPTKKHTRRRSKLRSKLWVILLACTMFAGVSVTTGCATGSQQEVQQSADDKLYDYRTILREQRAHPLSAEVARDLDLVEVWLGRAERMIAEKEDEEMLELQLQAIEGQLVQVRSYYARREAELELEGSRASYEDKMKKIKSERQRNEAQLDPLEQGGSR